MRIQIPLKIPEGNKCYIEFIETGERFYWQEGKVEIFNVEKLHQGKNEKRYRKKLFDDDIYEIIKSDEIYGVAYLKYSAHVDAKPHKDFNLWGKDFLRIQIPLKIPQGNKCYIEFIETGDRFYWQEGKVEIFNVEKLHQGKNDSDETMEFLYVDINPDTEVEL